MPRAKKKIEDPIGDLLHIAPQRYFRLDEATLDALFRLVDSKRGVDDHIRLAVADIKAALGQSVGLKVLTQRARDLHGSNEVAFDNDGDYSVTDDGVWVQGWLFVPPIVEIEIQV